MKYFSLSNNSYQVSFKEALFTGLAPDGGLYFPSKVKPLKKSFLNNLKNLSKSEIAYHVISQFVGDEIDKNKLIVSKVFVLKFLNNHALSQPARLSL